MRSVAVSLIAMAVAAACAVAPTPTSTLMPSPTPTATQGPWEDVWIFEEDEEASWIQVEAHAIDGEADYGALQLTCYKGFLSTVTVMAFLMPAYRDRLATAEAPAGYSRDEATAIAWVKRNYEIGEVFISRRATGEIGRWEKTGWKDELVSRGVLLRHTPSEAFINQLSQVEELAVLITDDDGDQMIQAIFDVRYVREALTSEETAWDCALPS